MMGDKIITIKSRTHDQDVAGAINYDISPEPKKEPDYTDTTARVGDDSWRKALVLWAHVGINLPPGQSVPFIYRLAQGLETYRLIETPVTPETLFDPPPVIA